jgi:hypothetical protein
MAKIKIEDLSIEIKMDKKELEKVVGGCYMPRPKNPENPFPWLPPGSPGPFDPTQPFPKA